MGNVTITRRLEIDAGHRLLNHESKCRNLHGHRYVFEIEMRAAALDKVGRVVDISVVKERVGGWLDDEWDHGFLVQQGDPVIPFLVEHGMKHAVLDCPPTAEHLSRISCLKANVLLTGTGVQVVGVRLFETPNCWAEYRATL